MKKGFTVIELLAVIVILAIIACISIPIIVNIVEKTREKVAIESIARIVNISEKYRVNKMMDYEMQEETIDLTGDTLKYTGAKPEIGILTFDKQGKTAVLAKYGKYCIAKNFEEEEPKVVVNEICETKIRYKESILNGADPILKDELIPVLIEKDGTVRRAHIGKKWYSYENKEWANAIILKNEEKQYKAGDIIPENEIESYFVWIPKYRYKIWNLDRYTVSENIEEKLQSISIKFGLKNTEEEIKGECINDCKKGDYITHPAFLTFNSNGFWVGKFETGYNGAQRKIDAERNQVNVERIIIKPNVYSWRYITVGNIFQNCYEYKRNLNSHMIKNTEWGAIVYLYYSIYGSQNKIRVNNNSDFITGYAAKEEPTEGVSKTSIEGNRYESTEVKIDGVYTVNYLNQMSVLASTTGNRTGIYDIAGGAWEYVMGYTISNTDGGESEITSTYPNFFIDSSWNQYYDKYTAIKNINYDARILGDATGEMGPFDNKLSSFGEYANFVQLAYPWFNRGGYFGSGINAGAFAFHNATGGVSGSNSFRIILTI